jgi:peptidoglycan hydrolase-like protein with peptidoglycan-binding domain
MQRILRGLGYDLVADGRIGPRTTEAVRTFQRFANLERAAGGGRVATLARNMTPMDVNGQLDANTRGWLRMYANALGYLDQSNRPGDLVPWF